MVLKTSDGAREERGGTVQMEDEAGVGGACGRRELRLAWWELRQLRAPTKAACRT